MSRPFSSCEVYWCAFGDGGGLKTMAGVRATATMTVNATRNEPNRTVSGVIFMARDFCFSNLRR